jgi:predicted aconitase
VGTAGRVRLELTGEDRAALSGERGDAAAMAMRIVVALAEASGARRLLDVESAHVDGCLYHGQASLDFAERLASAGARVAIPTTLNVGAVDLLHPELFRGSADLAERGRRLMELYVEMGCRPTFTCAPYQLAESRPAFGSHVAWAESNAIVFANSVLGARTDRYGDFVDVCAAITGRAPAAGLHLDEERRGRMVFRLRGVRGALWEHDAPYAALGHVVGGRAGGRVPVVLGLPPEHATEERLKALGAAAASSGAVAMFHAVGVTPEASTVEDALGGRPAEDTVEVGPADLRAARDELGPTRGGRLDAVSVGTPHLSLREVEELAGLVSNDPPRVPLYASTARDVLAAADERGLADSLREAGARLVVDTCTYVTPLLEPGTRVVMTNSGKWAYYAPGNVGVEVAFGTLRECVRSAALGRVWRDRTLWGDP